MLVFLAHLVAALYQRTRVPDVLFLILVGLALGPLTGLLEPGDFGGVGPVFTAVTLVVILFQGGIALDLRDLRRAFTGSVAVSLMGFVASIVVVGAIAFGVLDLGVRRSIMLGAILGGTSSIVVIPMVQQLRLGALARTVLAMESAITDVLCIVIALALLESLRLPGLDVGVLGGRVIAAFVLAAAAGVAAGLVWSVLLQRVRDLKTSTFTTAAFVFVVYGVIEVLGFSGAIAALAFGITPGNIEVFHRLPVRRWLPATPVTLTETEKNFFAELVFLLKTFFFVYIGLSLVLRDPGPLAIGLVVTVLLFAARAPVIRVSAPRAISAGDAALCSVIVPKGLAPAVLASLPVQQGIEGGELIQSVTYAVVRFSIVGTATLVVLVERTRLGAAYRGAFAGFAPEPEAEAAPAPAPDT